MMVVAVEPQAQRDEVRQHGLPRARCRWWHRTRTRQSTGDELANTPEAVDTHVGGHGHGGGVGGGLEGGAGEQEG